MVTEISSRLRGGTPSPYGELCLQDTLGYVVRCVFRAALVETFAWRKWFCNTMLYAKRVCY
jgi:hypothetical protein